MGEKCGWGMGMGRVFSIVYSLLHTGLYHWYSPHGGARAPQTKCKPHCCVLHGCSVSQSMRSKTNSTSRSRLQSHQLGHPDPSGLRKAYSNTEDLHIFRTASQGTLTVKLCPVQLQTSSLFHWEPIFPLQNTAL